MKIYTRTGDKGETSLFTGQRVSKNDPVIEALGTVDECNCAIGSALSFLPEEPGYESIKEQLLIIQHALFDLGAALATPRSKANQAKIEKTRFDSEEIDLLENWIDEFSLKLSPLKTFILPGGHPAGAMLHLARSICRRAERLIIPLDQHADVSEKVIRYLNRLSDYLFMVSRQVNDLAKKPETKWKPHLTANK
jgi:cob(I)alamin adenosyltransferase